MKPIANYTPKQMEEIIGFIEENFGAYSNFPTNISYVNLI